MKREIKSRGWNIYGLVLLLIVLGTISISSTMIQRFCANHFSSNHQ